MASPLPIADLLRHSTSCPGEHVAGARGMPEQITVHTERKDSRSPGFLHFKLIRKSDYARLHLLIPDLPGEWSTSLIENNRADRLRTSCVQPTRSGSWSMARPWLKKTSARARYIGPVLANRSHRSTRSLPTSRLCVSLSATRDLGKPTEEILREIKKDAARHDIDLSVSHIASFSRTDGIAAGAGIADLIAQTVARPITGGDFWPDGPEAAYGSRNALRIPAGGTF